MTEPTHEEKIAAVRALTNVMESVAGLFPDGLFAKHQPGLASVLRDLEVGGSGMAEFSGGGE